MELTRQVRPSAPPQEGAAQSSLPHKCASCGAEPLVGPFCHSCGQRIPLRLSFRSIAADLKDQLARLDVPLVRTMLHLSVHPGRTARAYIAGQRRKYSTPVFYAFVTSTTYALVLGIVPFELEGIGGRYSALVGALRPAIPYLLLIALLPSAILQRWIFRRHSLNIAECYAFLLFTWSQMFVISTVAVLTGTYDTAIGLLLTAAIAIAFHTWAFLEFYRSSIGTAVAVSIAVFAVTEVIGIGLGVAGLAIWRELPFASGGV